MTKETTASPEGPNPMLVACAGAGYEASRVLRLFLGDTSEEAKRQFSEMPQSDRDEMIGDAFDVLQGTTPPQLYDKYRGTEGPEWEKVEPVAKVQWTLFCAAVKLQFDAIQHVAAAMQSAGDKPDGK